MNNQQKNISAGAALLRSASGVDTPVTNSLCCAAAGITALPSSATEALTLHEKLRRAALADATLYASKRPHAQPAVGYRLVLGCGGARMKVTYALQKSPDVQEAA